MRISTSSLFDSGAARIGDLQTSLAKIQNQLAAGKRILTPSDDPVGASQALDLTQAQALNAQYGTNRQSAQGALDIEENALQGVTDLLQGLKTSVIQAGNGSLDDSQRSFIAADLANRLDDLIGLANTTDGTGGFIFSGYQTTSQPFVKTASGATYNGDQGDRAVQVGPLRQLSVSDNGSAIFERAKTGNGTFETSAVSANTGSGIINMGSVVNAALVTGHNYTITFTSSNTYDIDDVTAGTKFSSANSYVSGQSIPFDGIQLQISGAPASGDVFNIKPSKNVKIFDTLTNLINALKLPANSPKAQADLQNVLATSHNVITSTLDNVLTVRASVGSRLKEIDSLNSLGDDRDIQYSQSLSNLQDLDYTKAITDLSKQKIMLEAVQQSFVQTSNLSLFKFIS